MGRVELHGVEARLLHAPGGLAEEVDELEDLGDRGRPDLLALLVGVLVDDLVARGPRELEDPVGRSQRVVARDRALAARMLELDGALRAVAVHPLGEAREARDVVVAVGHEARDGRPPGPAVRRRGADDHEPGPAARDVGVVVDVAFAHLAVGVGGADVRRDVDHAVRQLQAAELDRAEEVRERRHGALPVWRGSHPRRTAGRPDRCASRASLAPDAPRAAMTRTAD